MGVVGLRTENGGKRRRGGKTSQPCDCRKKEGERPHLRPDASSRRASSTHTTLFPYGRGPRDELLIPISAPQPESPPSEASSVGPLSQHRSTSSSSSPLLPISLSSLLSLLSAHSSTRVRQKQRLTKLVFECEVVLWLGGEQRRTPSSPFIRLPLLREVTHSLSARARGKNQNLFGSDSRHPRAWKRRRDR